MFIYCIDNLLNGKMYIGQTTQKDVSIRLRQHLSKARNGVPGALYNAIRKYGEYSFTIRVLDTADTIDELNSKECFWIKFYSTMCPNGYNLVEGGKNRKWTNRMHELLSGKNHWTNHKKFSLESLQRKHDALYKKPSARSKTIRCIETGEIMPYAKGFQYKYGYDAGKILECCKGRRKTTSKLHWEFVAATDPASGVSL